MPTSSYVDFTAGVRSIGARTDAAGVDVADLSFEEDKLVNSILTEGWLSGSDAFVVNPDAPVSMDVIVGSGSAAVDRFVVEGDNPGQHPYIVQLIDVTVTVTLDASDASNPRIDEVWLVVRDSSHDAGSLSLPRISYRKGDAAATPAAPGPDSGWAASVLLASISVGAGVTSVGAGDITDERAKTSLAPALEVTTADNPGAWEVDGSTEVASDTLTATFATIATVALSIDAGWGSWRCAAHATLAVSTAGTTPPDVELRLLIDGTAQQTQNYRGTSLRSAAVGGRRTGMTTTGSRNVVLQARYSGGVGPSGAVQDVYLYARAVRTS